MADIEARLGALEYVLELALRELHQINPDFLPDAAEQMRELADQLQGQPDHPRLDEAANLLEAALEDREPEPGFPASRMR